MTKKLIFTAAIFLGSAWGVSAATDCDKIPKPALDCPTGYTVMCVSVGGNHWGCARGSNGYLVEVYPRESVESAVVATSSASLNSSGINATLQTQVRVTATSSGDNLQPAGTQNDYNEYQNSRVLPTVNKVQINSPTNISVRGWDPDKKAAITAVVEARVAEDANIKSADVSEDTVSIDYSEPARFLGFFHSNIGFTVSADASGRVKVKFPWYRFLFALGSDDSASATMHVYQHNQTDLEFLKLKDTAQRQTQIFQTLTEALKTHEDASLQASSNVK